MPFHFLGAQGSGGPRRRSANNQSLQYWNSQVIETNRRRYKRLPSANSLFTSQKCADREREPIICEPLALWRLQPNLSGPQTTRPTIQRLRAFRANEVVLAIIKSRDDKERC